MSSQFPAATTTALSRLQLIALITITLTILFSVPERWAFSPDAGVYVGTAASLLEEKRYWFNGEPNLLYYPGTSLVIASLMSIVGENFFALQLLFAFFTGAAIWLTWAYFRKSDNRWVAFLTPIYVSLNAILLAQAHSLLSDILFLNVVLLTMITWRRFIEEENARWYFLCAALVSLAPMFRFHGLFLIAAFGIAVLVYLYHTNRLFSRYGIKQLAIASVTLIPFALWTIRNYVLHTPETYNMANRFFFGLSGLSISGPGFGMADWIDAAWKIPIYQIMYLFGGIGRSFFGSLGQHIPLEAATACTLLLLLIGGGAWIRKASPHEVFSLAFILIVFAFTSEKFIGNNSLYILQRYWLPILPWLAAFLIYGATTIVDTLSLKPFRKIFGGSFVLLILFSVGGGVFGLAQLASAERHSNLHARWKIIDGVVDYTKKNVPDESRLATTDWGVAPFLTQRRSYQVLRSSCIRPSLKIIEEKGLTYLVIFPGGMRGDLAREMVRTFPDLFVPMYETAHGTPSYSGVFRIERGRLSEAIAHTICDWDKD
ncbi:MAG: glycosyltransferase family 39 protein [Gammaproteobacteria bacterium]|nr:glycosyltransferase family 39 protein [Gammaproteobacteria bacterium]